MLLLLPNLDMGGTGTGQDEPAAAAAGSPKDIKTLQSWQLLAKRT
jgi:hypothetical protein